jgi:hypothetical protein
MTPGDFSRQSDPVGFLEDLLFIVVLVATILTCTI